jgi:hypothetical protein
MMERRKMEYSCKTKFITSNIYCRELPFFSSQNVEMMEVIWINNIKHYGLHDIKQLPGEILDYFRSIKYGRDYCNRPYITLRKPFKASDISLQMDLQLCCLTKLLNESKAEVIHEKRRIKHDEIFISLCFGSGFLLYSYHIFYPLYLAKLHGAVRVKRFLEEVDPHEYREVISEAKEIIHDHYSHF